jgi:hypothetical protein
MATDYGRIVEGGWGERLIAVAAKPGRHAGVVYRAANGSPALLHLANHLDLQNDEPAPPRYVWVEPALEYEDAVSLAGYCRLVWQALSGRRGIPYGLRYDEDVGFDPDTGDLICGDDGRGMTCATFVVHLFRSAGNPLLYGNEWPNDRPGDRERQEELIAMLRRMGDPEYQRQADLISGQVGCPRIRPEEVAGACLETELPAHFDACERNGQYILSLIQAAGRA